jgi:hypothetical protein
MLKLGPRDSILRNSRGYGAEWPGTRDRRYRSDHGAGQADALLAGGRVLAENNSLHPKTTKDVTVEGNTAKSESVTDGK